MHLRVNWGDPLALSNASDPNPFYYLDPVIVADKPGIYIFGRVFGRNFEALYVGKAKSLRKRVKTQLNNLRLMNHLKSAKAGRRILIIGAFISKPGQRTDRCLRIIERSLIRHYLLEGDDLVNIQGTSLKQHQITCTGGGSRIPEVMFVEH